MTEYSGYTVGDSFDRFRTAALKASFKEYSIGFNLFTGDPTDDVNEGDYRGAIGASKGGGLKGNGSYKGANAKKYRLGALYLGYNGLRMGINSEKVVRKGIQNGWHSLIGSQDFPVLDIPNTMYNQYQSPNMFSLW